MSQRSGVARIAHFVIEGEGLTRIARDILLSDRPDAAFCLLATQLRGEGAADAAMAVLDGKKCYGGDSDRGIALVDDAGAADYRDQLRYVYAGRTRIDGRWFRPRARVSVMGREDAVYAMWKTGRGVPVGNRDAQWEFGRLRAEHYAVRGEVAVLLRSESPKSAAGDRMRVIIFEPCGERPAWWSPLTPEAALADWLAAGRDLEERSHHDTYDRSARDIDEDDAATGAECAEAERAEHLRAVEERAEEEDRRYLARLDEYRGRIWEQAGDGPDAAFELSWGEGAECRKLRVPRLPFEVCALRRTSLRALAPSWSPVCPSGMKLPCDDEYHTDWMVGAGLYDFAAFYRDEALRVAVLDAQHAVQRRVGAFECAVLHDAGAGPISGRTHGPAAPGERPTVGGVLVLPNLDPRYLGDAVVAAAVITENGGAVAHLAQVARERGVTIVRVPDARKRYRPGTRVEVDAARGRVTTEASLLFFGSRAGETDDEGAGR